LSEEKKEKETKRVAIEVKQSPPTEPVTVSPFQNDFKKGLRSPPPEPVEVSPFSQTKTTQSKQTTENKKAEGQQ